MIDLSKISEYFNILVPIITAAFGAISAITYNKFRKRTEEVGVTGTEHDTVKRISQSSIETIENLNSFSEKMAEKVLTQRIEFAAANDEMDVLSRSKDKIIHDLKDKISDLEERISAMEQEVKK